MIFSEAQQKLCTKLDIDFTNIALNGLFTLDDIKSYLNEAGMEAWDYKSWDFAEDAKTAVLASGDITNGYIPHPPTFAPSSIFLLKLNGVEQSKKNFQDFLKTFENNSASTDKYWSEFKRLVFFNPNLASAGESIDAWGKKLFVELSADADLMPFSPTTDANSQSGNEAVVNLAYAKALGSEKKRNPQQSLIEEKKAYSALDLLWKAAQEGRLAEAPVNRPMLDVPDFFRGSAGRGQNPQGTFTWN